jgi:hypothetical protein
MGRGRPYPSPVPVRASTRLTDTPSPLQNDLEEFFAMVDFTNPGVLGDAAAFRRKFEGPILTAREPWATGAWRWCCHGRRGR